ncbi:MAG TPA: signal peptidase II [Acidimicrobiia bacterium]|nr:signal peptidase II [Acidimicrobiia bacterium]
MPPSASAALVVADLRRALPAYGLASVVVALDQLTKRWAATTFASGPQSILGDFLVFRFTENSGAAFSLLPDAGRLLGLAAVAAVGFISYALAKPRPVHEQVAFGLVLGGAIGNLTDRIFRGPGFLDGPVIDWIQIPYWPTFNIADSAVSVAIAILLLGAVRSPKRA